MANTKKTAKKSSPTPKSAAKVKDVPEGQSSAKERSDESVEKQSPNAPFSPSDTPDDENKTATGSGDKEGDKANEDPTVTTIPETDEEADKDESVTDSFQELTEGDDRDSASNDDSGKFVHIRFVNSGLTALGKVWSKGQEVKLEVGSPQYQRTQDGEGNSFLDIAGDSSAQEKRWGRVMFEEV